MKKFLFATIISMVFMFSFTLSGKAVDDVLFRFPLSSFTDTYGNSMDILKVEKVQQDIQVSWDRYFYDIYNPMNVPVAYNLDIITVSAPTFFYEKQPITWFGATYGFNVFYEYYKDIDVWKSRTHTLTQENPSLNVPYTYYIDGNSMTVKLPVSVLDSWRDYRMEVDGATYWTNLYTGCSEDNYSCEFYDIANEWDFYFHYENLLKGQTVETERTYKINLPTGVWNVGNIPTGFTLNNNSVIFTLKDSTVGYTGAVGQSVTEKVVQYLNLNSIYIIGIKANLDSCARPSSPDTFTANLDKWIVPAIITVMILGAFVSIRIRKGGD